MSLSERKRDTMDTKDKSRLKRPIYPMPDFVRQALERHDLMAAYRDRPAYQQNDYVGWITRAKRQDTRQRRLAQMLDELTDGTKYMKMDYKPSRAD